MVNYVINYYFFSVNYHNYFVLNFKKNCLIKSVIKKKKNKFIRENFILYIEYNVVQPSPLNEKVLREKRRKLKETFDRVMKMYVSTMLNLS